MSLLWRSQPDNNGVGADRYARPRPKRRTMWRRLKPGVIFTVVLLAVVGLLSCLAGLIPPLLPSVAPALSRMLFGTPESIWAFYIDQYNTEYTLATSDDFTATLAIPFAPGADLASLGEWATMRRMDGEVISYTLTMEQSADESSSEVGLAQVWWAGRQRCYEVVFVNTDTGYLIRQIKSALCPRGD